MERSGKEKNYSSKGVEEDLAKNRLTPSMFLANLKNRKGHLLKTVLLGLSLNFIDVSTDVGVGISHAQAKNVTRFFLANR